MWSMQVARWVQMPGSSIRQWGMVIWRVLQNRVSLVKMRPLKPGGHLYCGSATVGPLALVPFGGVAFLHAARRLFGS
jgi:hypothetical protein